MGSKKRSVTLAIPVPDAGKYTGNLRKLYGMRIAEEITRQAVEGRGKRTKAVKKNIL